MEQNPSNLFNLNIDPTAKVHLTEAGKWAKFLGVTGMILLIISVAYGIYYSMVLLPLYVDLEEQYGGRGIAGTLGTSMIVVYIILGILGFFPCLFLINFANHIKTALNANDQNALNSAFRNLKVYFRYVGVITIICLALFAIILILFAVGRATY